MFGVERDRTWLVTLASETASLASSNGKKQRRLRTDLRASCGDGAAFGGMVGVGETYLPAFVLAVGLGELTAGLVGSVPLLAGGVLQMISPSAVRLFAVTQTMGHPVCERADANLRAIDGCCLTRLHQLCRDPGDCGNLLGGRIGCRTGLEYLDRYDCTARNTSSIFCDSRPCFAGDGVSRIPGRRDCASAGRNAWSSAPGIRRFVCRRGVVPPDFCSHAGMAKASQHQFLPICGRFLGVN